MRELWGVYHTEIPPLLKELAQTPPMQRLRGVGMNCGCEYTAFRRFAGLAPYTRYDHSIGVGLIVWHFTGDKRQAAAGLLHDIATPPFAHVVDFLHGDYLQQESTERGTAELIAGSEPIRDALHACGLQPEEVDDYHRYPIADNDSPKLSADRLEYTLGNAINYGLGTAQTVAELYLNLCVARNEEGEPELCFSDAQAALQFAELSLACSEIYVSDEDRYSMQRLAELLAQALERGVLSPQTLRGTELALILQLQKDPQSAGAWEAYCGMSQLRRSDMPFGAQSRRIDAKRRYIDPLVAGQGRVSCLFPEMGTRLRAFRERSFDYWIGY